MRKITKAKREDPLVFNMNFDHLDLSGLPSGYDGVKVNPDFKIKYYGPRFLNENLGDFMNPPEDAEPDPLEDNRDSGLLE